MRSLVFMNRSYAKTARRALSIVAVACLIASAHTLSHSAELSQDKPILLVGNEIEAVLDVRKKEVRITRFSVDKLLPTGKLQHRLSKPYVVRLVSSQKIEVEKIAKFKASDWDDGIGVKIEMKIFLSKTGEADGTINITTQHEETSLYYSAQQLKVRQD